VNKLERKMVEILERGKSDFQVVSVKAEFEAEGTRTDELLRLVDVSRAAGLPLTLKIGGCEAIRDLLEAKQIGVRYVVAPMIETPYALSKYIQAKNLVFSKEEQEEVDFLFNLETITAFRHLNELVDIAVGELQGLVFGRVDFSGSMGLGREGIESEEVTEKIVTASQKSLTSELDLVVGGAVSNAALPVLQRVSKTKLTRFETRKVVFSGQAVGIAGIHEALLNAVHFELLWLLNKRDYYSAITKEDAVRIDMLESRWQVLGKKVL
jgi:hypothetical protein